MTTATQAPLFAHQQNGVSFLHMHKRSALFWDPGTGKTRTVLEFLKQTPRTGPTLILCPATLVSLAWGEDARTFAPELPILLAHGTAKKRREAINAAREHNFIVVMGYEGALASKELVQNTPWSCVILDESTRIKNHSSKISKLVHRCTRRVECERVHLLTGCPTPNGMQEIWRGYLPQATRWETRSTGSGIDTFSSRRRGCRGFGKNAPGLRTKLLNAPIRLCFDYGRQTALTFQTLRMWPFLFR